MADPVTRSAARLATAVAVPVALVVGVLVFNLAGGAAPADPEAESSSSAPATPVTVDLPKLTGDEEVACRALLAKLPDTARGAAQRPVTDGAEQAAAYGEPAVTLVCGVDEPEVADTETVYPMGGTCWVAAEGADATVWTTVDRKVAVALTVPGAADGSGQWATAFSETVAAQLRKGGDAPSGCG